jgi:signal transduction histidine kinase
LFQQRRIRSYLLLVSLPILFIGVALVFRVDHQIEKESLRLQAVLSGQVKAAVHSLFLRKIDELLLFDRITDIPLLSDEQLQIQLNLLLAHDTAHEIAAILDLENDPQKSASRTQATTGRQEAELFDVPNTLFWEREKFFVGQIYYDDNLRTPLFEVAIPIRDLHTGELFGILALKTKFHEIWDVISKLNVPEATNVQIIRADGLIVADRDIGRVLAKERISHPTKDGRFISKDDVQALAVVDTIQFGDTELYIIVTRSLSSALSVATTTRIIVFVTAGTVWFLAVLLALFLARYVETPTREMAAAAKRIAAGDLNTVIPSMGPLELRRLAVSLAAMTEQLRRQIDEQTRRAILEKERAVITLEAIKEAVIVTDNARRVQYMNPAAVYFFASEPNNQPLTTLLNSSNSESIIDFLDAENDDYVTQLEQTAFQESEHVLVNQTGREVSVMVTLSRLGNFTDSDNDGWVIVLRDITSQKIATQAQTTQQKLNALSQFTGGIAHDFNNLLAIIIGYTELMLSQSEYNETSHGAILAAAERGVDLTRRLLVYAGQYPLELSSHPLEGPLHKWAESYFLLISTGINFEIDIATNLWPAKLDLKELENATYSLLENGREALDGFGTLILSARNTVFSEIDNEAVVRFAPGSYVAITVQDTGIGIAGERMERILEPFFTTKEFGTGSGLGLAMVAGYLRQIGGGLKISSQVGQGTSVTMYLPHALDDTIQL